MAEEVPKPLLYRPPPPLYFWGAFGAALAIHLTAVALAQKHEVAVEVPPDIPTAVVEATLQASEEPTPPPEDIPLPEPPPPPEIPANMHFFGYGTVPNGTSRRAFFTDGEDVFIVSEGEVFLNRFRILKVNNASLDFEEVSSGRHGTKALEEQGATPSV